MRFLSLVLFLSLVALSQSQAQSADPVLFSVDGRPVHVSEFTYIYSKNNRDDADFSESSLREYLDLYTKFKLKVREAYAMGLDTLPTLQSELAGYRKQLAESYLNDKEITDRLVREAYDRTLSDVRIAHILIRIPTSQDTTAAHARIWQAHQLLSQGQSWDQVVRTISEDPNSTETGGDLGYITALLPNGFYAVESAAYETPVGSYSQPVRSSLGYHIIKVLDKRPARGEMEVAHILLRVGKDGANEAAVKSRIEALHRELLDGGRFEDLARRNSEDKTTADRGGFIGPIGINQFEKAFEEALFNLEKDGDFSAPVRTSLGWHIVKRTRQRPILPFDSVRRRIEVQIAKDERVATAREAMISRIKQEAGYRVDEAAFNALVDIAGDELQTYRWQVPTMKPATLLTIGGETYSNVDLAHYVRNNARIRMSLPKGTPNREILEKVLEEFSNEKALLYEEKNLARKYPEFANLMREYEEGILLFEATKQKVWDRASKDTTGLQAFHAAHRNQYMWDERLEIATLTVDSAGMSQLPAIRKLAAKKHISAVEAKMKKKNVAVTVSRRMFQRDEQLPDGLGWTAGQIVELPDGKGIAKVERIVPPAPKTLDEARGYIIADYQDKLEKEWVQSLQARYPVVTDESVLRGLIRR